MGERGAAVLMLPPHMRVSSACRCSKDRCANKRSTRFCSRRRCLRGDIDTFVGDELIFVDFVSF